MARSRWDLARLKRGVADLWTGLTRPDRDLVSRWVTVDGRPMHARVGGPVGRLAVSGRIPSPPIVLVHGLVVSSRYMLPLARNLAQDYAVYAPDLPGFGKSAKPPRVLDVPALADAVAGWLDAAGLPPAVFVGNSLGCRILVDLAIRHPACVLGLVLAAPAIDPHTPSLLLSALRLLADEPREHLSMLPIQFRDLWDAGIRTALGTARAMVRDPIVSELPQVAVPTLVVRGTRDPIVPESWVEEAASLLPAGRLVIISGAPHALNFSASERLAEVVREFLDEDLRGSEA